MSSEFAEWLAGRGELADAPHCDPASPGCCADCAAEADFEEWEQEVTTDA